MRALAEPTAVDAPRGGGRPARREADRRAARAFGLELDLGFEVPGLRPTARPLTGPVTTVDVVTRERAASLWSRAGERRIGGVEGSGGRAAMTTYHHPVHGYKLAAQGSGHCIVSPDGLRIACVPPSRSPWHWQRMLIGQVLPLAAAVRGLEVFHASAVALDGRALVFVGPPGAGKTSVAANLALAGAAFMTDDVVAFEPLGEGVVAHPGVGLASVRHAESDVLGEENRRRLGERVGRSDKLHLTLHRDAEPEAHPLGAVYYLLRSPAYERLEFLEQSPPDPRPLLGSTFVSIIASPERRIAQLDVCARIARTAPTFEARVPAGVNAAELSRLIERHAGERLAAAGAAR